ncbi:hypothetical protein Hanom_Chr11g01037001 [Helianthus anomalus]
MMGSTDSPPPPLCCSVFVFESFRVSGQWLTMVALVLIGSGLWLGYEDLSKQGQFVTGQMNL